MLEDLSKDILNLIEQLELLDEDIIDDSSKEDIIYELENLNKSIESNIADD